MTSSLGVPFPPLQPSTDASSPRKPSLVSQLQARWPLPELHSVSSVPFKKTQAINWQATSTPQADFAGPMPTIELVASRRFYIKIPTSGLASGTANLQPPCCHGHCWRERGTRAAPWPRAPVRVMHLHGLPGPLGAWICNPVPTAWPAFSPASSGGASVSALWAR